MKFVEDQAYTSVSTNIVVENVGRIRVSSARNFPNAQELGAYINSHGIQDDNRDYLIGAEHIDSVIRILS